MSQIILMWFWWQLSDLHKYIYMLMTKEPNQSPTPPTWHNWVQVQVRLFKFNIWIYCDRCWWQVKVSDFMLVTIFGCWSPKSVINICHQHYSPTSITNIDEAPYPSSGYSHVTWLMLVTLWCWWLTVGDNFRLLATELRSWWHLLNVGAQR